ncbi:MAG: ligase-associated DNA damage response endonuclease PdeM [Alphaproteobacteria bacterium]
MGITLGPGQAELHLHLSGALWWPAERMVIVSDLHLEKGSAFAARGVLLPPWDTAETLKRLAAVCEKLRPRTVLALGDSFHDGGGSARLHGEDRRMLRNLMTGRNWVWLTGNHDPAPPDGLGGECMDSLERGGLTFRHEPLAGPAPGEVAGHLHPAAAVRRRGRRVRRRCFAGDGARLVMPAFGAYTGGLDVTDAAFAPLFAEGFTAWLLGRERLYPVTNGRRKSESSPP